MPYQRNFKQPLASEFLLHVQELHRDPKTEQQISLDTLACVTGAWTTSSADAMHALDDFHSWSDNYIKNRTQWRPKVPATIIELQCWQLESPIQLQNEPELWGCFSWVEPKDMRFADLLGRKREAVLPEEEFRRRQGALRRILGEHDITEVSYPKYRGRLETGDA